MSTYTVTREIHVDAPPAAVYAEVIDFHRWEAWSPWEKLDPNQDRTYSGADSGVGSVYAWSGNRKVGKGSMTLTDADDAQRVEIDLAFEKPFRSTSQTTISIAEDGPGSRVTWSMTGPKTLMTRVVGVVKSMDAMVGPDFERGLASLKQVVESNAPAD